jgi:D-tyrosyl-tRNA(Tyr) deacylase
MKAVIQRVEHAAVHVDSKEISSINEGLLILLGITHEDDENDISWLVDKIIKLRIFNDSEGKMNISVIDADGELLIVSQFTLHASTKKGNRPSYIEAARPEIAIPLYEKFINQIEQKCGKKVKTGEFGAMMKISLVNDGPVTIIIDSKNRV